MTKTDKLEKNPKGPVNAKADLPNGEAFAQTDFPGDTTGLRVPKVADIFDGLREGLSLRQAASGDPVSIADYTAGYLTAVGVLAKLTGYSERNAPPSALMSASLSLTVDVNLATDPEFAEAIRKHEAR